MISWYKVVNDIELKDGSTIKEDRLVFETTDRELSKRVERFFKSIMDEPQTYITEDRDTQILDAWQVHHRNTTTAVKDEQQTERSSE